MTFMINPYAFAAPAVGGGGGGSVSPTFGASGTGATVRSGGSVNIPYPAGISAGDYLEISIALSASANTGTASINVPSGWTQIHQTFDSTVNIIFATFWKQTSGSESGSVAVTCSALTDFSYRLGGKMARYSGVDISGTPYELLNSTTGLNSFTMTGGKLRGHNITTTRNGSLILSKFSSSVGNTTMTPGTGWTEHVDYHDTGSGPDLWVGVAGKASAVPETTAYQEATPSAQMGYMAVTYALKSPDA